MLQSQRLIYGQMCLVYIGTTYLILHAPLHATGTSLLVIAYSAIPFTLIQFEY